mgnify:CR=1 FL=1
MEIKLKNQELHEFAQWFAFHYGGGIGGSEEQNEYPREDIIALVDSFIKERDRNEGDNIGFVKWFAEKYEIYGDCIGRPYQNFSKATNYDTTMYYAKTTQEWVDQHFKGNLTDGLLYNYFQAKIQGNIFQIRSLEDLKKELEDRGIDANAIKMVYKNGEPLN